ncbi:GAF domain-containing protein [Nocardioides perillae]|uniref:protein-serine/threonine phosphatase n=1 Tax=Nocardioides perillae TaxID=1119534 RepID=A0A7Y9RTW2_9ACTN|nr:GAF domain-containing protein [Nocardioides perillae]
MRRALGVPVALVSLVEAHRQSFVGMAGLPLGTPVLAAERRETPLTHSFCQHVVAGGRPLLVGDAREHLSLRDNLAVPDLGVVAYAGWPLTDHTGQVVGSLCAIDHEPRAWDDDQVGLLEDLAAACSAELAQRGLRREAVDRARDATELERRSRVLLSLSEGLATAATLPQVAAAVERTARDQIGCLRAGIWLCGDGDDRPAADLPRATSYTTTVLRWVDSTAFASGGLPWAQARRHADLRPDATNPLGEVLGTGLPSFLPDRAAQNARWPHLASPDQVGEARAFLPLTVHGRTVGVLALVWEDAGEVSAEHRVTLAALASYAAQATQRALAVHDRVDALVTLQSAMTSTLPRVAGHALAARYRPASSVEQVGGDWYDAVSLPAGRTALTVGDVAGHDMRAAATMGQLRSMLRALAWATPDEAPAATVERLDRAACDLQVPGLASLVFAHLDPAPDGALLTWANAGHPPPVVVTPDGAVALLADAAHEPMIGIAARSERRDRQVRLRPGATVLLYTDGLVERRREHLDAGLLRLAAAAERHAGLPVDDFVDALLAEVLDPDHRDDVALLALRVCQDEVAPRP